MEAQALTETIRAAENRLAVALAVVEGTEPPDDGGGPSLPLSINRREAGCDALVVRGY
jgi:hypothetical protein